MEYNIIHAMGVQGDVYSRDVDWMVQNTPTKSINNVLLFSSVDPVDLYLQTALDMGIRSVGDNAKRMKLEGYTPLQSVHSLWGLARVFWDGENIRYRLDGISDDDFRKVIDDYLFPSGRTVEVSAESIEDQQYRSPGYWVECVAQMQEELNFSPADKRGWQAIKKTYPGIRSLEDFEKAVHLGNMNDSIENLHLIKLVSEDFAYRLLTYFSFKFRRMMS
jgi:hypothetical protein